MPNTYRGTLIERYLVRYTKKHALHYEQSPYRDSFLETFESSIGDFYYPAIADPYQSELVDLFKIALHFKQSSSELYSKIMACRKKWYEQYYMGTEYGQDYIELDEFILVTNYPKIFKNILRLVVSNYYLNTIAELKTARLRGGLRDREEMAILRRMQNGNAKSNTTNTYPERGFRWKSPYAQTRIKILHERLVSGRYIHSDTKVEQFVQIFSGDPVEHPTVWIKSTTALVFLFQEMIQQEMLTLPEHIEAKSNERRRIENLQKKVNDPTKNMQELKALKQEISHWLYLTIAACFISKDFKKITGSKLKHASNQLNNRKTSETPAAGRDLTRLLRTVSLVFS